MNRNLFWFFALLWFFLACKEEKKPIAQAKYKESKSEVKSTKKKIPTTHLVPKVQPKPKILPPDPYPPYDPIGPCPIEPPGYILEPVMPKPFPKTIRDSIVNFPATMASFGNNTTDIFKYIDEKIAESTEWKVEFMCVY